MSTEKVKCLIIGSGPAPYRQSKRKRLYAGAFKNVFFAWAD